MNSEKYSLKIYIKILRIDHWIKQLFILPGVVLAIVLTKTDISILLAKEILLGFIATCIIASANYVLNEWLDRNYDKYHPQKKNRPMVTEGARPQVIYTMYVLLAALGLAIASLISLPFLLADSMLLLMGMIYNIKPLRFKDIAYLDVLTESANNAIRFLLGWFIVSPVTIPPSSIILGYWFAGAFLMASKRFAEYRMISDKKTASLYRKSCDMLTRPIEVGASCSREVAFSVSTG